MDVYMLSQFVWEIIVCNNEDVGYCQVIILTSTQIFQASRFYDRILDSSRRNPNTWKLFEPKYMIEWGGMNYGQNPHPVSRG